MADRNKGVNGPVPWAGGMKARVGEGADRTFGRPAAADLGF